MHQVIANAGHKLVAGAIVGVLAAASVVGLDFALTRVSGDGVQPLQAIELRTYDWRLVHTAQPETAVKNIALIEIDEYSLRNLQPNAGRWPWPRVVHSMLFDYLSRGPAKVVAYDVNFAEPDDRMGFKMGEATMSGAESDQALADSIKANGSVILLADATYEGNNDKTPLLPDYGYRLTCRASRNARSCSRQSRSWPKPRPGWVTTCSCSTPTA